MTLLPKAAFIVELIVIVSKSLYHPPYLATDGGSVTRWNILPDFSIDPTKSEFKTVRVWARSCDVSPDTYYIICSDSHSPNLPAASCRAAPPCSTAPYCACAELQAVHAPART